MNQHMHVLPAGPRHVHTQQSKTAGCRRYTGLQIDAVNCFAVDSSNKRSWCSFASKAAVRNRTRSSRRSRAFRLPAAGCDSSECTRPARWPAIFLLQCRPTTPVHRPEAAAGVGAITHLRPATEISRIVLKPWEGLRLHRTGRLRIKQSLSRFRLGIENDDV